MLIGAVLSLIMLGLRHVQNHRKTLESITAVSCLNRLAADLAQGRRAYDDCFHCLSRMQLGQGAFL